MFCFFIAQEYVRCGGNNPLWCCVNAFTVNKECVYALCNKCYGNAENTNKVKRSRARAFNSSFDCNDAHSSNHFLTNLEPFTDETYLDSTFLAKKIGFGSYVPQRCSNCNLQITNSSSKF